jgi:hypothetical protein
MTTNEQNRRLRYRVNVSTSVKGIRTWDCTVDGEFEMAEKDIQSVDGYERYRAIKIWRPIVMGNEERHEKQES